MKLHLSMNGARFIDLPLGDQFVRLCSKLAILINNGHS